MPVAGHVTIDATVRPPEYRGHFVVAATQDEAEEHLRLLREELEPHERQPSRSLPLSLDRRASQESLRDRQMSEPLP